MFNLPDFTYENYRRVIYGGDEDGDGGYIFIPVCPKCGRFVKSDDSCYVHDTEKPNATCKKCGRIRMPDEGYTD